MAEKIALYAEASGVTIVTLDGMGNTIDDAEFFPDMHGLVSAVADRLTRLMDLDRRLISALHKVALLASLATLSALQDYDSACLPLVFTQASTVKYERLPSVLICCRAVTLPVSRCTT